MTTTQSVGLRRPAPAAKKPAAAKPRASAARFSPKSGGLRRVY